MLKLAVTTSSNCFLLVVLAVTRDDVPETVMTSSNCFLLIVETACVYFKLVLTVW